ncbi:MAG: hypothetical protein WD448_08665 [Woeseia sp.]
MAAQAISDLISSGERSRLIPVVSDMSKEERAVSPVLAAFSIVPALAHSLLQEVGGPTNQRATVRSYSQVVFKRGPTDRKWRPDGLLEVDSGRKVWRALIEAKIGNAELSGEQVECYLDLAKQMNLDALITISNQFSTLPTHHPIAVNKMKVRRVELYHFSWLSILTKARLLSDDKTIDDPEQAFITVEMSIPNAAARLCMEADFLRRSLRFSISLNTPQDKTRPTAAVNWATRQLASSAHSSDTLIRARWPGRAVDTVARLSDAIADPKSVAPDEKKELPVGFEIQRVVDLAARFKGSSTFIEDARRELPRFYKDVVQNVANWVPKAPKYKETKKVEEALEFPAEESAPFPAIESTSDDPTVPSGGS